MTSGHNAPDNTCNTTPAEGALTWVLTVSSSSAVTSCLVAILTWPPHCIFAKYCQFTLPYQAFISLSSSPVYDQFSCFLLTSLLDCTLSVCLFGLPPCVSTSPLALLTLSLDLWKLFNKLCIWILLRLPPQLHYNTKTYTSIWCFCSFCNWLCMNCRIFAQVSVS